MAKIFINLPVSDLPKATAFYEALWFTKNPKFSDNNASGMSFHDDFHLMLLSHSFTISFLPPDKTIADSHQTTEVFNAIQFDSRQEVDELIAKAIAAGGKTIREPYDHGFMYGHDFEDIDGHIWEPFWMDDSQMPQK